MTIFDWLERFEFLRGLPAVYLVMITAVIIMIAWDWRIVLFALAAHYLLTGLLFVDVLDPRLAIVKVLVGLFVCLIMYITARQVNLGKLPPDVLSEEAAELHQEQRFAVGPLRIPATLPRRLILAPLMITAVFFLGQQPEYALPLLDETLGHFQLAIYTLIGMGLLGMALTTEPWQAGIGLLLVLTGFELFYIVVNQALLSLALFASVNLAVAVVVAYLTQGHRYFVAVLD
ncbi:MAG: hypothetical protein AAF614_27660 [Chloroflexota bacterium]